MKTLLLTCTLLFGCSLAFDAHAIPPAPPTSTSIQIDAKLLEAYNQGIISCKELDSLNEIEMHLIEEGILAVYYYNVDTTVVCFDKLPQ